MDFFYLFHRKSEYLSFVFLLVQKKPVFFYIHTKPVLDRCIRMIYKNRFLLSKDEDVIFLTSLIILKFNFKVNI